MLGRELSEAFKENPTSCVGKHVTPDATANEAYCGPMQSQTLQGVGIVCRDSNGLFGSERKTRRVQ